MNVVICSTGRWVHIRTVRTWWRTEVAGQHLSGSSTCSSCTPFVIRCLHNQYLTLLRWQPGSHASIWSRSPSVSPSSGDVTKQDVFCTTEPACLLSKGRDEITQCLYFLWVFVIILNECVRIFCVWRNTVFCEPDRLITVWRILGFYCAGLFVALISPR